MRPGPLRWRRTETPVGRARVRSWRVYSGLPIRKAMETADDIAGLRRAWLPPLARVLASAVLLTAVAFLPVGLPAQEAPLYRSDFKPEELAARRQKVLDAIGKTAIAIVQGAPSVRGFEVFRQSNEFYYLTGLEVPHAYLLLDGR